MSFTQQADPAWEFPRSKGVKFEWLVALDMDGTLIDSREATTKCLSLLCSMMGLDISRGELQGIQGECAAQILGSILKLKTTNPVAYLEDIVDWANRIYPNYYMWRYSRRIPGVSETVRQLSRYARVIILSSNVGNAVIEFVAKEGIERYVEEPSPNSEYESKRQRLFKALAAHHILPSRTVYVGDTLADIEIGRELGVRTMLVLGTRDDCIDLTNFAGQVVQDIAQIPSVLRSWQEDDGVA